MIANRVLPYARAVAIGLALCAGAALPGPAAAQEAARVDLLPRSVSAPLVRSDDPSPLGAFLASAVLPGAGQYRLGDGRWVAYAGIETWAWINWFDTRGEARDLEGSYRDLAWNVARRIGTGGRVDREFEYYEAMSAYSESGSFDADPDAAGVQPEEDTTTFNGDVWELARLIYYPAGSDTIPPSAQAQEAALEYYEANAIAPRFAWSWGSSRLEHEQFRTLIRRSDEAARSATTLLGAILVNHVVSAVDALLSARLRQSSPTGEAGLRIRTETLRTARGSGRFLVIEVATP